ncbi:pentapeptide repeat-containing protein [Pandoraea bronchicola]|uniref:Type III secretion system effector protein n=1 Tax=Pandoraea bronchicola TaxID=2508287 RepID=A0A5E5BNZ3_9BURK|nr:pentapeptide repeat-containing protein [Pandoraea bronchicola]VVE86852.1 type III secretion system effector protein [Pandoraea bronchicola]
MYSAGKSGSADSANFYWANSPRRPHRSPQDNASKAGASAVSTIGHLEPSAIQRIGAIGFAYACAGQHPFKQWGDVRLVFFRDNRRRDVLEARLRKELEASPQIRADMIPAYVAQLTTSFDNASDDAWQQLGFSMTDVSEFARLPPALQSNLLTFTDASVSDLCALRLSDIDLRHVDFRSGILSGTHWRDVDASDADFTGVNLTGASLHGISFVNTSLRDAQFENLRCLHVDFTGADLTHATVSLDTDWLIGTPETADEATARIDTLLREDNGWEFLASIASIDNRHSDLKRALMCQLIESLETLSVSDATVWRFISSWVSALSDPVFWESPLITAFINAYLPVGVQATWNREPVPRELCVERLRFHIEYLLETSDHPQWPFLHQGAVHQLVLRARATSQLDALADELFEHFLRHPSIASAARILDDMLPGTSRDTCIFLSDDTLSAVACTPDLLKAVIDKEDDIPWHSFYVLRRATPEAHYAIELAVSPESALRPIPLLHARYQTASGIETRRFARLLRAYWETGETSAGEPVDDTSRLADRECYRRLALDMPARISSNHPEHKLTTIDWQIRLQRLFALTIRMPESPLEQPADAHAAMRLHPEVKAALWRACLSEMPDLEDTLRNQAAFELIEAIKQTQLASSLLFGTETESPVTLRYLACALLNEAFLDAPDMVAHATLTDWRARLVGDSKEMATCTATLSDEMMAFVMTTPVHGRLREIYDAVLPHAWRR